eukprot:jgi/Mesvir1/27476/Mv07251-RA.1
MVINSQVPDADAAALWGSPGCDLFSTGSSLKELLDTLFCRTRSPETLLQEFNISDHMLFSTRYLCATNLVEFAHLLEGKRPTTVVVRESSDVFRALLSACDYNLYEAAPHDKSELPGTNDTWIWYTPLSSLTTVPSVMPAVEEESPAIKSSPGVNAVETPATAPTKETRSKSTAYIPPAMRQQGSDGGSADVKQKGMVPPHVAQTGGKPLGPVNGQSWSKEGRRGTDPATVDSSRGAAGSAATASAPHATEVEGDAGSSSSATCQAGPSSPQPSDQQPPPVSNEAGPFAPNAAPTPTDGNQASVKPFGHMYCTYVNQEGGCKYGDRDCWYKHPTKRCAHYDRFGICYWGTRCTYIHIQPEGHGKPKDQGERW